MELSAVPEALVTVCAVSDEMKGKSEGKGEPAVLILWKGQRKVAQSKLSQTFAGASWLREKQNQHVMSADTVVIVLVLLDALERETRIFTTWSDVRMLADREDNRSVMIVKLRFARALCLYHFCSEFATVPCQ